MVTHDVTAMTLHEVARRTDTLNEEYAYLILDARYERVREAE